MTRTILNPDLPESLISRAQRDRWLRPVLDLEDDWTQLGFGWEIIKHKDAHGRLRKIYWKGASVKQHHTGSCWLTSSSVTVGSVGGYHAALSVRPGLSYGVIVLATSRARDFDVAKLVYDIYDVIQPMFDVQLALAATRLYSRHWKSADGKATAHVQVRFGTLWLEKLEVSGVNILHSFGVKDGHVSLRPTGWPDEFR